MRKGARGSRGGEGNQTHLKPNGNSVISREMSVKGCDAHRYDTKHSEAVAAALRKSLSTQGLLYCGFQQAVACLLMLVPFARARDSCSAFLESARHGQEVFHHYETVIQREMKCRVQEKQGWAGRTKKRAGTVFRFLPVFELSHRVGTLRSACLQAALRSVGYPYLVPGLVVLFKTLKRCLLFKDQWARAGSNRRHQDFQSCALPTELHALFVSGVNSMALTPYEIIA